MAGRQELTNDEVLSLIKHVSEARQVLVLTVTGLTAQQELFKPRPDAWSITTVLEHLVLAEHMGINRMWQAAIGVKRGRPIWSGTSPHRGLIIEEVIERTWKVTGTGPISIRTAEKAPVPATPAGDGPLGYWVASLEACQPILEQLGTVLNGLDLTQVIFPHAISGPLDARQRLQFLGWHLNHHRQQIEDIKASPDFPIT
ncbi:MAG: hypothetical protein NVSMB49_16180 [Ktedonobacteraceae bacterium]